MGDIFNAVPKDGREKYFENSAIVTSENFFNSVFIVAVPNQGLDIEFLKIRLSIW